MIKCHNVGTKQPGEALATIPLPVEMREDPAPAAVLEPERLRAVAEETQRAGGQAGHGTGRAGHRDLLGCLH